MIRLLVLDVDGTMTDGGVYYDATGNELKKFAIKDGAGLVLARADYICPQRGGEGAVRGAVEKILRGDGRWNDAVKKAFQVEL